MNRNILLARSNIRKAKGQTAAIIVLVLLSSLMMNLWLMLSMDYRKNFDRCHDRLNDGHVNIAAYVTNDEFKNFISDTLDERPDITGYTVSDAFCAPFSFEYNGGEMSQLAVVLEKEDVLSRNVGKMEITQDSDIKSGIYLPMLYGTGNNYAVGDTMKVTFLGEEFEYTVCGFFNSAMSGSHNCAMVALLMTEDKFEEFSEEAAALKSLYISARIEDVSKCEEVSAGIKDEIAKEFPDIVVNANDYKMITTSRYVSQMICAGILSAMAFLVLLIGVVVIASNIANYIQENMQNLGALKAVGYTSGQLVAALLAQFAGVSSIAAVIGTALSYCVFPAVNEMMIAQTGIPYAVRFQPMPVLFTVIFITGIVSAAVYFSAKKIKKIEPITAMRQGISTHNFKKNHLPLEKTSLPVNAALAMKTTLGGLKQNVTVCVTMLVISLILVFSATSFSNSIMDMQPMIEMIAGEFADLAINVNLNREDELVSVLENDSRVKKFYLFTTNNMEVQHVDGLSLFVSVVSDCSKMNNQSMFVEGRYPKYGNEVSIAAKYAKDNDIKIGDEISLKVGNSEEKYIVSGYTQESNYLGKDCVMTREGYEKLSSLPDVTYYINLAENIDIDDFNNELSDRFGSDVNAIDNIQSILESTCGVYVMLMTFLVIAIVIISCIVIVFVMYLLVRTTLNNKKRDYGILKALGFTTPQLIVQTAMSFMPSIIISSAVGIAVSMQIINPLMAVFLSGIGVVKGTFIVPVRLSIIAGIVLVIFAFGSACLMSLRVKKIAPRELLTGE
ncbi:MAG: ABC transporter permease [Oscillospiraceae bacterium]|nr:ABC transporter permease [Oscillospiraceae bacterium]